MVGCVARLMSRARMSTIWSQLGIVAAVDCGGRASTVSAVTQYERSRHAGLQTLISVQLHGHDSYVPTFAYTLSEERCGAPWGLIRLAVL